MRFVRDPVAARLRSAAEVVTTENLEAQNHEPFVMQFCHFAQKECLETLCHTMIIKKK
jgi:hypothetical protein